jgi:hypothetical protein
MPLRLVVSLIIFSFACGVGANVRRTSVCLAQDQGPAKKPTPTPTPPPDGPNPGNPGGPSKQGDLNRSNPGGPSRGEFNRSGFPGRGVAPRDDVGERSSGVGNRAGVSDRGSIGNTENRRREARWLFGDSFAFKYSSRRKINTCDTTEHEQEDLTGTYSGKIEFPSRNLRGPATLDIKGQRFILSINGVDLSGSVSAETTCDYTAVAMRFETAASPENSAKAAESISLKAQRIGSTLILTSVEGQTKFEFAPVLKPASRRRR